MTDALLKPTPLLDFHHPSIEGLIESRGWRDLDAFHRIGAAYGGVYIAASLAWLWMVEGREPDRWDVIGAGICLVGAGVILLGPRSA